MQLAQTDQQPAPNSLSPTANGTASDTTYIHEVIVTARKREERLLDVPVAVSAFTGEMLEQRGAADLLDFLQETPGVNIYSRGDGLPVIAIRGISTTLGSNENGYYLDDLPFTGVTIPFAPDVRTWDLERVEILRGPQGTLFGEGSVGGTVRILTRDAQFNDWEAQSVLIGSNTDGGGDNWGAKALVNIPLVDDRLALRLAGTKEHFDGWIDAPPSSRSNLNESDIVTYRAKLRFEPTDRLSLKASYWHYDADFPDPSVADDDANVSQGTRLASALEYDLLGTSITYDFGPTQLFYSFSRNDLSYLLSGPFSTGTLSADSNIVVRAHELRLSSSEAGALQWTLGAYQRDAERPDELVIVLPGINSVIKGSTEAESQAVFGEATYTLPSVPLDLTAGLRYVRENVRGDQVNPAGVVAALGDHTYESVNPRFSIAVRPTDDLMVYVSAAKGYRAGQLQPEAAAALGPLFGLDLPTVLTDDSIWSYELGGKASLWDRRLMLEGATYYSEWKDVAVRVPLGTTGLNGLINSDGTETMGVEASASFQATERWMFNVGASYADAQYAGDVPGTGIREGELVDDIAKTTAQGSVHYRRTLINDLLGTVRLGAQYNSARTNASFGPPLRLPGDGITTVDARLGVEGKHWSAFVFGDNLTNEDGAANARAIGGADQFVAARLRPLTVGLELHMKFGE